MYVYIFFAHLYICACHHSEMCTMCSPGEKEKTKRQEDDNGKKYSKILQIRT